MRKEKSEFRCIWLLLAGFVAAAGAVLILCLTFRRSEEHTSNSSHTTASRMPSSA